MPVFLLGVCLSVTLHIVDLWQYYVCLTRSGNPTCPLYGSLRAPYVLLRVVRYVSVAHRYTYALLCCRTSQYHRTFISMSVSLYNDLGDPIFDGVGLAGFKSGANAFLLA